MKIKRTERSILDILLMLEAFTSLQTVLLCPSNILNFDVRLKDASFKSLFYK